MERLLSSKSIGTNAVAVAAFGQDCGNYPGDVLAGIGADQEGKVLCCETRPINQDRIVTLTADLREPRKDWGGFEYQYTVAESITV